MSGSSPRSGGSCSNNQGKTNGDGSARIGDLAAMARILVKLNADDDAVGRKRKLVAQFCKLVAEQVGAAAPPPPPGDGLSPRARQTLERLLAGDSEKQIAIRLAVSRHTVHVYVKNVYRHYDVNSRGELLARFVATSAG